MKSPSRPAPLTAQVQAYQGPLAWRHLVDWLQEDGVISQDEADRTIARCSQGESSQPPLVRLAAVGIGLSWDEAGDLPDPLLDTGHALHLHRIVREAISNTIRHAQARHLRVRVRASAGELLLELTDDGSGVPAAVLAGSGMRNMRTRAGELDGRIDWAPGTEGGAKVLLRMPLEAGA